MIVFSTRWVTVEDIWFEARTAHGGADLLNYYQADAPGSDRAMEFTTLVIDLHQSEEALLGGMKKGMPNKIRRSMGKDPLVYQVWDGKSSAEVSEFVETYDHFAKAKSLDTLNRPRFEAYVASGNLDLSSMRMDDGAVLCWHTHYRDGRRARLLQSVSNYREYADAAQRQLIGRANRRHHWQDMLRFKAEGIAVYDLGGWYPGTENEELLRVNHFKEEFGGTVARHYYYTAPGTLKGRIYLWLRDRLRPHAGLTHIG